MADPIASVPSAPPPQFSPQSGGSGQNPALPSPEAAPASAPTPATPAPTTPTPASVDETPAAIVSLGGAASALTPGVVTPPATPPAQSVATQLRADPPALPAAQVIVSDAVAQLMKGMPIAASVAGTDYRGTAILRTADGTFFSLSSNTLPPGASIELMAEGGDLSRAVITRINQQILAPPAAVGLRTVPADSQLLSLTAQAEASRIGSLQTGQMVTARLIAGTPGGLATFEAARQVALPGGASSNPVQLAGAAARAYGALADSGMAGSLPNSDGPAELRLIPRHVAAAGQVAPPPGPGEIQARVLGRGLGGETLFKTEAGIISLQLRHPPANGATVNFAVQAVAVLPRLAPTLPMDGLQRFFGEWPALREAVDVLRSVNSEAAQQLMHRLPQPDGRLLSTSLMFMTALETGAAEKWIGEGVLDGLRQAGRSDLAQQLVRDFDDLSKLAQPRTAGEWQAMVMPFFTGSELRQIQVYVRRRRRRQNERRPPTRFVIDLELEKTGPIQFDGLTENDRLDLTMRSGKRLPGQWENDIRAVYEDCVGATGMRGTIVFQAGEQTFVKPASDLQSRDSGSSGVMA